MANLFDKRCAVSIEDLRFVNDPGATGAPTQLPDGRIAGNLRLAFKVERNLESKANKAEAQIFNLGEDSRGQSQLEKPSFVIEAGYRDTFAQIFQGTAVEIRNTRESTGFVTTVKAADGFKATRARVSVSLSPGLTAGDAMEQIIKSMKVAGAKAIAKAKAGDFTGGIKTLWNGLTMSGNARDEMDKLARTYGFDWSIQNGEIQILLPTETTGESAIVLGPLTGLLTSPIRVIDEKRPGAVLARAQALLHPKISPGRIVQLESEEISGQFKTEKVTHVGDTATTAWFSQFDGIEI